MSKIYLSLLNILLIMLLTVCGKGDEEHLLKGRLFSFMPKQPVAALKFHSHEQAMRGLFSLIKTFFNTKGINEIKTKVFGQLTRQWNIALLNKEKLNKNGFDPERAVGLVFYKKGKVFVSIPHNSAAKIKRFMKRNFSNFKSVSISNKNIYKAKSKNATCIISRNRVYLISGAVEKLRIVTTKNSFFKMGTKKNIFFSGWFSPRARNIIKLPIIKYVPVPVVCNVFQKKKRLEVVIKPQTGYYDPIFRLLAQITKNWHIPAATGWSKNLYSFARIGSFYDKFAFFTKIQLKKMWASFVKPAILASARKQVGKVVTFFSKLLGGKKSLIERQIDKLNITSKVMPALTGKIGFCLTKLNSLSFASKADLIDSFDGFIVIEAKSHKKANSLLEHLSKQLRKLKFYFDKRTREGISFYSLPLFRFGFPTFLFVMVEKKMLILSQKFATLKKLRGKLLHRGSPYATGGRLIANNLRYGLTRYFAYLSVAALYYNIAASFDATTQANLRPLRTLITKVNKASISLSYIKGKPQLHFSLLLNQRLAMHDPFSEKRTVQDWLLIILGWFFALLIVIPTIWHIYKKIKYRT